jgi:hypothetical protein
MSLIDEDVGMIKTVKQACEFNPIITDYRMAQGIESLSDLIADEGDGREFFKRNFVTQGMEQLFREGMLRLSGLSDQAVFELSQAMGGGKTHMMTALGLLARHEHLRSEVLPPELARRVDVPLARIAAFNGRNNPDHYIWGEIASQLGKANEIKPFWVNGPKSVDQATWEAIIGDEPTLILLDEIPPYLDNASTLVFGQGTLANMVTYSLSTLMTAALKLPKCCIVISNLSGSYHNSSGELRRTLSNLQQETKRQAMTITPVQLSGNEIYEILKKRLIEKLPDDRVIADVAEEYAHEIKKAEDGGYIVAASIEQITEQIRETYPFHPSFKHLVALFKENEEFRQTRGLMQFTARLLKSVAQRDTDDVFLIGTQHLDLNDPQVTDEISRINAALAPAISRDISDNGNAIAEVIDAELDSDAAEQVMVLLLTSSLSRAVGGRLGLSDGEIIEFLAAPNRKPEEFLDALQRVHKQAHFLHREDDRFIVKETENLRRRIDRDAKQVPQAKIDQALINRLSGILSPNKKIAYQEVQVLPKIDEIKLTGSRILIVVKPDGRVPPSELQDFFQYQQEKNNMLVLSGQDSHLADTVEERLRELYAVEQIHKRLKSTDPVYVEARDLFEESEGGFNKALSAAYNRLYFPGIDGSGNEALLSVTIDNGLKNGTGDQSAEVQIEKLLSGPQANYKLVVDLKDQYVEYWAMAEVELWPKGEGNRKTPWRDLLMKAKFNPAWPWMPGASGMESLKNEALKQGRWRQGEDGYIEKGPFPKEKTSVNHTVQATDPQHGGTILTLTPRNAGESPVIYCSNKASVSETDERVDDPENFYTERGTLYFLVKDSSGTYDTGEPVRWVAELKIRHQVDPAGDGRRVTLQCTPAAEMFYSLDGTNPKDGIQYSGPFEIGNEAATLLVYAHLDEATRTQPFQIPSSTVKTVQIDETKPATFTPPSGRVTLDTTDRVFSVLNKFKTNPTRFKDVKIEIGEDVTTATVRLGQREVTAQVIETIITSVRDVLGETQAPITITISGGVQFDSGFDAKEFASLAGIELRPGSISQEA